MRLRTGDFILSPDDKPLVSARKWTVRGLSRLAFQVVGCVANAGIDRAKGTLSAVSGVASAVAHGQAAAVTL
eukprot:11321133-Prorocentrum_lima.AAC.1